MTEENSTHPAIEPPSREEQIAALRKRASDAAARVREAPPPSRRPLQGKNPRRDYKRKRQGSLSDAPRAVSA